MLSGTGARVCTRAEARPTGARVLDELQPVNWWIIVRTANERFRALHAGPKWPSARALVECDPGAESVGDSRAPWAAIDGDVVSGCAGRLGIPARRRGPWFC